MTRDSLINWALAAVAVALTILIVTSLPAQSWETLDLSGSLPAPAPAQTAQASDGPWRIEASLLDEFDQGDVGRAPAAPVVSESEQASDLLVRTTENYQRALESSNPGALLDERVVIIEEDIRNLHARRDQLAENLGRAEQALVFRMRANESQFDSEDPRLWLQNSREMDSARLRMEAMQTRIDEYDSEIQAREIQLEDLQRQREEQQVTDTLQAPNIFEVPAYAHDPQRPFRELYESRLSEAETLTRRILMRQVAGIDLAPVWTAHGIDLIVD